MQTYFGYFGRTRLRTHEMIKSTCWKLKCFSACRKQTSSFTFPLRYYILKNPAILLTTAFWTKLEKQIFARYEIGGKISVVRLFFILGYFQEELRQNLSKNQKKLILKKTLQTLYLKKPFWSKFGEKWIYLEKSLYQFWNIPVI